MPYASLRLLLSGRGGGGRGSRGLSLSLLGRARALVTLGARLTRGLLRLAGEAELEGVVNLLELVLLGGGSRGGLRGGLLLVVLRGGLAEHEGVVGGGVHLLLHLLEGGAVNLALLQLLHALNALSLLLGPLLLELSERDHLGLLLSLLPADLVLLLALLAARVTLGVPGVVAARQLVLDGVPVLLLVVAVARPRDVTVRGLLRVLLLTAGEVPRLLLLHRLLVLLRHLLLLGRHGLLVRLHVLQGHDLGGLGRGALVLGRTRGRRLGVLLAQEGRVHTTVSGHSNEVWVMKELTMKYRYCSFYNRWYVRGPP
eukprot:Rhum_TRINITY_DN20622_c0_g1::Rhum_TRINITY_DN20622_c0_g1_i1::g.171547::m.171547